MRNSGTTNSPAPRKNGQAAPGTNRVADTAVCAWFLLTAVAFWGPYAGLSLPFNVLTALYAVFLLTVVADAALRLLRSREEERRG